LSVILIVNLVFSHQLPLVRIVGYKMNIVGIHMHTGFRYSGYWSIFYAAEILFGTVKEVLKFLDLEVALKCLIKDDIETDIEELGKKYQKIQHIF
jgi:diaminopimelate decarboxylase